MGVVLVRLRLDLANEKETVSTEEDRRECRNMRANYSSLANLLVNQIQLSSLGKQDANCRSIIVTSQALDNGKGKAETHRLTHLFVHERPDRLPEGPVNLCGIPQGVEQGGRSRSRSRREEADGGDSAVMTMSRAAVARSDSSKKRSSIDSGSHCFRIGWSCSRTCWSWTAKREEPWRPRGSSSTTSRTRRRRT